MNYGSFLVKQGKGAVIKLFEGLTGFFSEPAQMASAVFVGVLLGLGTFVYPKAVLPAIGGAAGLLLILQKPTLSLVGVMLLLTSIIPETDMPVIHIGPGRLYISEPIVIGMLAYVFIRWLVDARMKLVSTPLDLTLFLFYAWAITATVLALIQGTMNISYVISEVRILSYYMVFFAVTNLASEERNIRLLIRSFFILATITSLAMIVQYFLGYSFQILEGRVEELSPMAGVTRITDTPGEALVTMAVTIKSISLLTRKPGTGVWKDFLQWMLFGAALLVTFNRTHWIMVVLAVVITFFLVRGQKRDAYVYWGILLFLLVMAVLVFASIFPDMEVSRLVNTSMVRFTSILQARSYISTESTLQWRNFEYRYGLPHIAENPVFGLGLGAVYRPTIEGVDHPDFSGETFAHNGFLWIAMKTGLPGLLLIVLTLGLSFVRGFRHWRAVKDPLFQSVYLGTTLLVMGLFVGNNIHPLVITLFWTPLLGIFMGLNESILRVSRADCDEGVTAV